MIQAMAAKKTVPRYLISARSYLTSCAEIYWTIADANDLGTVSVIRHEHPTKLVASKVLSMASALSLRTTLDRSGYTLPYVLGVLCNIIPLNI